MKAGFKKISIGKYLKLYLKSNPGTKREEIAEGLKSALKAYKKVSNVDVEIRFGLLDRLLREMHASPVLLVRHILIMITNLLKHVNKTLSAAF